MGEVSVLERCLYYRCVYQKDVCIREVFVLERCLYQRGVCIGEVFVLERSAYQRYQRGVRSAYQRYQRGVRSAYQRYQRGVRSAYQRSVYIGEVFVFERCLNQRSVYIREMCVVERYFQYLHIIFQLSCKAIMQETSINNKIIIREKYMKLYLGSTFFCYIFSHDLFTFTSIIPST